jgi:hypothetical protein
MPTGYPRTRRGPYGTDRAVVIRALSCSGGYGLYAGTQSSMLVFWCITTESHLHPAVGYGDTGVHLTSIYLVRHHQSLEEAHRVCRFHLRPLEVR